MSDIDLWGDDLCSAPAEAPAPLAQPLVIALLASPAHADAWHNLLQDEGFALLGSDDPAAEVILVDPRDCDHSARLEQLKGATPETRPSIFFLLESGAGPDCIRALEAGADDYALLPITSSDLAARLRISHERYREDHQLRQQLATSSQIAFQSMSLNAELGRILQYMEASFACQDYPALARLTLEVLNELGMHGSLGIFHDGVLDYFCDDGIDRPIEQAIIENSRHLGRLSSFGPRTILNYPHIGLLVRNMPLDDAMRYGILKDHLCYLGNGLEARCQALITERRAAERGVRIQATASVLQQMLAQMEQAKLEVTRSSTEELQNMLDSLQLEFSQLSLTGPEEDKLMGLLAASSDRLHALFRGAAQQDQQFQALLSDVAKTLEH